LLVKDVSGKIAYKISQFANVFMRYMHISEP